MKKSKNDDRSLLVAKIGIGLGEEILQAQFRYYSAVPHVARGLVEAGIIRQGAYCLLGAYLEIIGSKGGRSCYVTRTTICRMIHITRNSYYSYRKSLEELGIIEAETINTKTGSRASIVLNLDLLFAANGVFVKNKKRMSPDALRELFECAKNGTDPPESQNLKGGGIPMKGSPQGAKKRPTRVPIDGPHSNNHRKKNQKKKKEPNSVRPGGADGVNGHSIHLFQENHPGLEDSDSGQKKNNTGLQVKSGQKTDGPDEKDFKLARMLEAYVRKAGRWTKAMDSSKWAQDIRRLRRVDGIAARDIRQAILLMTEHCGEDYMPETFSGSTLRKKWEQVWSFVQRCRKRELDAVEHQTKAITRDRMTGPVPPFDERRSTWRWAASIWMDNHPEDGGAAKCEKMAQLPPGHDLLYREYLNAVYLQVLHGMHLDPLDVELFQLQKWYDEDGYLKENFLGD